jgi:superfamily II DNA or RNA helicase
LSEPVPSPGRRRLSRREYSKPTIETTYRKFLVSKEPQVVQVGIEAQDLNPALFPWQADIVRWALRLGRAALFEDCGLGKSLQQLEWARQVHLATGENVLILAPLAVTGQTVREGARFGIPVRYCREQAEVQPGITVTNYERLESFDAKAFVGVVLDESSILKAFSGKTKRALISAFSKTRFRLACTATPAPNDVIELGNHAEFLGLMESSEMLTRWFINDTMAAGNYRLKGHAEADFWNWCATWAACLARPSDLRDSQGNPYSDDGYVLPELCLTEHVVAASDAPPEEGHLFRDARLSATTLHKEMRLTIPQRVALARDLVAAEPQESWVIWCHTNDEADALKAAIPEAIEVRGSDSPEEKESRLTQFSEGRARVIITKASIAGFGLNWAHCARHVYCGMSYSFEEFYQALRRGYRFGLRRPMNAHVIVSRSETGVRAVVMRKQQEHGIMQSKMAAAMRDVTIADRKELLSAKVGEGLLGQAADRRTWEIHHGDCVEVAAKLKADSMHLSVFSPPFAGLYTYSASLRDMGNSEDDAEFYKHFGFLVPELLRITVPGRLCVVHTKDLPAYKNTSGASGLRDLAGELTRVFEDYRAPDGSRWVYHSKVTIWKCPVTEMQRTKSHGLLYKTLKRDASYSRQGCPDYLTVYRKWTPECDSAVPVAHNEEDLPLEMWQRYASPVWMDIDQTDVLNVRAARSDKDSKHICPLQLGVIERCIHLWTNPGETVFSPFAGIGSEGYVAVKKGRRFVGVELKEEYFQQATRNIAEVAAQQDLFVAVAP